VAASIAVSEAAVSAIPHVISNKGQPVSTCSRSHQAHSTYTYSTFNSHVRSLERHRSPIFRHVCITGLRPPKSGGHPTDGPTKWTHFIRRSSLLPIPKKSVRQSRRLQRGCTFPTSDRHHQHVLRFQSVPRPRPAAHRSHKARHPSRRRPRHRLPDHQPSRIVLLADQHVSPQPHVDGHGGDDQSAADGCVRHDWGVRQDGSGAVDGGNFCE
jgi:hypothetical protein